MPLSLHEQRVSELQGEGDPNWLGPSCAKDVAPAKKSLSSQSRIVWKAGSQHTAAQSHIREHLQHMSVCLVARRQSAFHQLDRKVSAVVPQPPPLPPALPLGLMRRLINVHSVQTKSLTPPPRTHTQLSHQHTHRHTPRGCPPTELNRV